MSQLMKKLPRGLPLADLIGNFIPVVYNGPHDTRANVTPPSSAAWNFPEYINVWRHKCIVDLMELQQQILALVARHPIARSMIDLGLLRKKTGSSFRSRESLNLYNLLTEIRHTNGIPDCLSSGKTASVPVNALVVNAAGEYGAALVDYITYHSPTTVLTISGISENTPGIDGDTSLSLNNIRGLSSEGFRLPQDRPPNLLVLSALTIPDLVGATILVLEILHAAAVTNNPAPLTAVIKVIPTCRATMCLIALLTGLFPEVNVIRTNTQTLDDTGVYLLCQGARSSELRKRGDATTSSTNSWAEQIDVLNGMLVEYLAYITDMGTAISHPETCPGIYSTHQHNFSDKYQKMLGEYLELMRQLHDLAAAACKPYENIGIASADVLRHLMVGATDTWVVKTSYKPAVKGAMESATATAGQQRRDQPCARCGQQICVHKRNVVGAILRSQSSYYRNKTLKLFGLSEIPDLRVMNNDDAFYELAARRPQNINDYAPFTTTVWLEHIDTQHAPPDYSRLDVMYIVHDVDLTRSRLAPLYLDLEWIVTYRLVGANIDEFISNYRSAAEWAAYIRGEVALAVKDTNNPVPEITIYRGSGINAQVSITVHGWPKKPNHAQQNKK